MAGQVAQRPSTWLALHGASAASVAALTAIAQAGVRVREGLQAAAAQMAAFGRLFPEPHAFTPDLDLVCTVRRCGMGPEEHQ